MMAMGSGVRGGLASEWPGCRPQDLVPANNPAQGNLKVPTDYRSVYRAVIAEWLGDDPGRHHRRRRHRSAGPRRRGHGPRAVQVSATALIVAFALAAAPLSAGAEERYAVVKVTHYGKHHHKTKRACKRHGDRHCRKHVHRRRVLRPAGAGPGAAARPGPAAGRRAAASPDPGSHAGADPAAPSVAHERRPHRVAR